MELYDFVLECLSDSEILDDWNPSDRILQKASDIVTEYLSEPDYRERFADQIIESIDAGCYENGMFFEALNYEPYLSSGFNDDVPMLRSMTSVTAGKLGLHTGSLEKTTKELGWRKSLMCVSANEMNL